MDVVLTPKRSSRSLVVTMLGCSILVIHFSLSRLDVKTFEVH